MNDWTYLENYTQIFTSARASDDGTRCAVSASPEAREKLKDALKAARESGAVPSGFSLHASEPTAIGLNDGVIIPPDTFPLGTSPSVIRSAAADRVPLRGMLRVIVVLVDFADKNIQERTNIADVIAELYRITPSEITFKSLYFTEQKQITIQGFSKTRSSVNNFQNQLVNSAIFEDVTLQYASRSRTLGEELTDFKITVKLSDRKGS